MNAADWSREARTLDASDPLAPLRERFALPQAAGGGGLVYLCGHSLGAAPKAARVLLGEELDDWERLAVAGHHVARRPWIDYAEALRPGLARLAGASASEVVAMNSLTVNLHLLMASFYRPAGRRRCIVVEEGAFSSDRHAVVSQLEWHGLSPEDALIEIGAAPGQDLIEEAAVEQVLAARGAEVALVLWPGVQYRTGQQFDIGRIARAAHRVGATAGFDLAHAIGNVPLHLHDDGADFAAWCSYKYLNAGPGATAGAFVHARHPRAGLPGLAGWWGHDPGSRFRMEPGFVPAPGAAAWQLSNPPILATAPLLASLALYDEAGMAALRAKSLGMTQWLLARLDAHFDGQLACVTPRDPERRGCQLSLRVRAGADAGKRVFARLAERGIVADWREPDILRIAPAPLYNTYADLAAFLAALGPALQSGP